MGVDRLAVLWFGTSAQLDGNASFFVFCSKRP